MKTFFILILILFPLYLQAEDIIPLPKPEFPAVKLEQALKLRKSCRTFKENAINRNELSTLLWSAFGINREAAKKRTAPSAFNFQDIIIYVFLKEGIYLYEADQHQLKMVKQGDYRESAGIQEYVAKAPVSFVYVSDFSRMHREGSSFTDNDKMIMAALNAGHISQNLNLAAAVLNLGVVTRGSVDKDEVKELLQLDDTFMPILGQTAGYEA